MNRAALAGRQISLGSPDDRHNLILLRRGQSRFRVRLREEQVNVPLDLLSGEAEVDMLLRVIQVLATPGSERDGAR